MAKRRPFLHPGEPIAHVPTPADVRRFLDKVEVDAASPVFRGSRCWRWTDGGDEKGYGRFWLGGACRWAHRAAYHLFRARLRRGQDVDHVCRNRACVCPRHLRATTRPLNSSRNRRVPVADGIPF